MARKWGNEKAVSEDKRDQVSPLENATKNETAFAVSRKVPLCASVMRTGVQLRPVFFFIVLSVVCLLSSLIVSSE